MTEHTTPEGDTINLTTGCDTCTHVANTVGVDLKQSAAVNAVANVLIADLYPKDGKHHERNAATVLTFICDALHRDGPDADAIRETLGLRTEQRPAPHGWAGKYGPKHVEVRRFVSDWREVKP